MPLALWAFSTSSGAVTGQCNEGRSTICKAVYVSGVAVSLLWKKMYTSHRRRQAPWQWPPSASLCLNVYSTYAQGVAALWLWLATLDWDVSGTSLGCCCVTLCPSSSHFTPMRTLSSREWMGTWMDSDHCLGVQLSSSAVIVRRRAVCSSGSWEGTEWNESHNQGNLMTAHRNII